MTKFSTLVTPEGKEFVFKIPKNARPDSSGFYRIDDNFKSENPEMDFAYLAHDLLYRGLNCVNDFYERNGVKVIFPKYEIKHLRGPIKQKSDDWQETADAWLFIIKGHTFEYFTGIGHRVEKTPYDRAEFQRLKNANLTDLGLEKFINLSKPVKPSVEDLFYSLVSDSDALEYSFNDWCDCFGYDTDSRKALEIYTSCQNNADKLRKLGLDLHALKKYYEDF